MTANNVRRSSSLLSDVSKLSNRFEIGRKLWTLERAQSRSINVFYLEGAGLFTRNQLKLSGGAGASAPFEVVCLPRQNLYLTI